MSTPRLSRGHCDHLLGAGLFAFIPLVLYLFVGRPEPLGLSLAAGVFLMLGHRLIARPYMRRVAPRICLWTHRNLDGEVAARQGHEAIRLHHGGGVQTARCLRRHRADIDRFFTFLRRFRPLLAAGIFAPLLLLLTCLSFAASGLEPPLSLPAATAIFQLVVGLTVNAAAWGHLAVERTDERLQVGFPAHNFFLLGIGKLLWIFRLVGLWWILRGLRFMLS